MQGASCYKGIFLCCFLFLIGWGSSAAAEAAVLRVGYLDVPGYLTRDADGQYSGYAYEYMEAIAPYGNWQMEYVPSASRDAGMKQLQAGDIDVIAGVLQGKEETWQQFLLFSARPFAHTKLMLYTRNGQRDMQPGCQYKIGYFEQEFGGDLGELQMQAETEQVYYIPQSYETAEAVYESYQQGRADGYIGEVMTLQPAAQPAAILSERPTFLAVRADRTELMRRLDMAMRQVYLIHPRLQSELLVKYFTNASNAPLLLDKKERDYLQQKKQLTVLVSPGQRPYTYFEDGVHQGVIADILRQMEKDLGIELVVRETGANDEMLQQMTEGKADILADFYYDYNWGHEHQLLLTFPYMELNYVAVTRRNEPLPEHPRVACPTGHFYTHAYIEKMYDADQLVYYDTPRQCLEAVSLGQADMTVTKAITAQEDIWRGSFYNLITTGNVIFSHKVAMGVNDRLDPILQNILNKEIAHLNPLLVQDFVNKAVFSTKEDRNIISLIYRYPLAFLGGSAALALLIIGSLLYVLRERRKHLRQVRQLAYTEYQTGMPNLRWFYAKTPHLIAELRELRQAGRLFIMDFGVNRIDILRETYGHQLVQEVLCRRVKQGVSENAWLRVVAVMDGTGRTTSLCSLPEGQSPVRMIEELFDKYDTVSIHGLTIRLDLRAGVCMVPAEGGLDLHHLVGAADIAYHEIQATAEKVGIYDEKLRQELALQKKIEGYMEKALLEEEFEVWCQPKYDISRKRPSGAEALVRWRSPELGFLMPGKFIDLFERTGFIVRFDYYMLEHVCRQQRERLDAGLAIVPISVNQSRLHMNEAEYIGKMRRIAKRYQLPRGCVELELTETAFADFLTQQGQYEHARWVLESLRELGFSISMDDFGSGYSSLALLKMLPMDIMKIDRSLLVASEDSQRAQTILSQVVQLGKSLQMEVICEGIETAEQEQLLLRMGCSYGQGFLYAKPMPNGEFEAFMDAHMQGK